MKTRVLRMLLNSLLCLALLAAFSTSSAQAPDPGADELRVRPTVGGPDPSMAPKRSQLLMSDPPPPEGEVLETMELPTGAFSLPAGFAADLQASRNPKLDSAMAALVAAAQVSPGKALDIARSQSLRLSGTRVHVQVSVRAQGVDNAIRAVTRAGGEVTGIGNKDTLIQGWLPIDALEAVAAHDDVFLIRRPAEVVLPENLHAPSATTEGLAVINGPAWHTAGFTGAGVKVGIIDGGFMGYPGLLGTDLPASVTVKNFVDGENDSQVNGTTEHGTACAEIIHDIAPDATLYLVKIGTNVDLQEAAEWLRGTHHVDIISTSLSWYNLTPGDGTGEFADLVQGARDSGILWVTAAGNERESHWGGAFSPSTSYPDVHAFDGVDWTANCLGPGTHDGYCYIVPAGYPLLVYLRWDDWDNVDQDYDLCLLGWTGSEWDVVTCSVDEQNGGLGQSPTEAIGVYAPAQTLYAVGIVRYSATRNVHFELFLPTAPGLDWREAVRSLSSLADAPDAMTVAALDVVSPYPQESYSSEGPTNGLGGTAAGGFTKPDISGFANVSTESYGAEEFAGTSSSTPHVTGAAALVLSAYPGYTPAQLQSFLESRAVDMGSSGMDTVFGHGRLYLGDPSGAANTAPTISSLPDQVVPVSGSADNAIDLWAYADDAEDASDVMTYTIGNLPTISAGVSIDSNRYVDINPSPGWTGVADVEVQVEDTGGLTDTDEFRVTVFSGKTWDGSVSDDWHNADNWTPAGVPTSGDDVIIPDVANDPVISSGDAAANNLVVSASAVLDLTSRTLTVEGTLTNNGSLKQTQATAGGSTASFLRITNLAGDQTKYYGVDITPYITPYSASSRGAASVATAHINSPTVSDGLVSVTVDGNQLCSGRTSGVRRCFDVDTAAAMNATVRFYFSEAERNGKQLDNLVVFHYNGGWAKEPGPYTRGGTGDAQYVEAQNVDGFSLFALDTGVNTVYMPLLLKRWPPIPDIPVLNAISNSDGDGNYTVSWQAADLADTYVLQEDDNFSFSSPTQVYAGSGTSRSITGRSADTYYYRVKAISNWEGRQLESGWSNVRSVKVFPPTRLYPTADAVIFESVPGTNFGDYVDMYVGYDHCFGLKITRSLVKFNTSSIPAGTSITRARLYLYLYDSCDFDNRSHTVTAYRTNTSWSELSVTWNNQPGRAEARGSTSMQSRSLGWYSIDVTELVRGWVNGSFANHGLTLRGPEGSGDGSAMLMFYTRESATHDPYLRIEYAGTVASEEKLPAAEGISTLAECGPTVKDALSMFPGSSDYGVFGLTEQTICSSE